MDKLDIVYILRDSSHWNNNEIRYSLRSLKNLEQVGRVFLIGFCPNFINLEHVIHIKAEDPYKNKIRNAVHKLKIACRDPRVSDDFILMNDDFFFLKPVSEIEYFVKGKLDKTIERHETHGGYYCRALNATNKLLKKDGLPNRDFEVHYPMIFNKKKLFDVIDKIEGMTEGVLFRSIYGNTNRIEGKYRKDVKIFNEREIEKISRYDFISTDDHIVTNEIFQKAISRKLKEPSVYEILWKTNVYATECFNYGGKIYNPGEIILDRLPDKLMNGQSIRVKRIKTF